MPHGRSNVPAVPKTVEEYIEQGYLLEIGRGDQGSFVVRYPDLPGCVSQATTLDEAFLVAREILAEWLEIAIEDGQTIPLPRKTDDYSGRFLVRLAKSLHRDLAEKAREEGISLNTLVMSLLAEGRVRYETSRQFAELCSKINVMMRTLDRVSYQGVPQPHRAEDASAETELPIAA